MGIALLHPDSGLPLAPRLGTADTAAAHRRPRAGGADVDELLRLDSAPPVFTFRDPQQNLLVVVEDGPGA
ncbi:hypothetical protein [Kineococcus terrestris]|uniref:hypothetical protein n=1 Tax=Kineococcus terrestris TaxID=2044856 RepID=UPI0034DAF025